MPSVRVSLLLAALTLLGAVAPVAAIGIGSSNPAAVQTTDDGADENGTAINVTPGAQLATVLAATEVSTRGEIDDARFEFRVERRNESERAEAIAERAEVLAERAAAIREAYDEATAARKAGDLSPEAYARRLAELNARAEQLLAEIDALRSRARSVSAFELRAAGLNRSALQAASDDLDPLAGVGPSALLQRFLGESAGEVELRTEDGLRVEVEGEAGERSLEVTRPRDDNASLTIPQDDALQTARDSLPPGDWVLTKASVHPDSGYYKFEFDRRTANLTGEAEVRVDGSSGEVFRLEVEIESPDDERDEDDDAEEVDDADDRELTLLLVGGTPGPNETITVRALADGEPAANLTVAVNDHPVAETDANGEATVRLPNAARAEVTAGDEAELEFEFDEAAHEEREIHHRLDVNASLHDGRVTVRFGFDGSPVEGATVHANDRPVGSTDSDGTVAFDLDSNETDELELVLVKGAFVAELEYDIRHGELVLTEMDQDVDAEEDDEEDTETEADDAEEDEDSSGSGSGDEETEEDEEDDDSSGSGSGDEETETDDDG